MKTDRNNLQIREDRKRGISVEGLSEWTVKSPHEIYQLLSKGTNSRVTASNKLNDISSRSHAVFIIMVEQIITESGSLDESIKQIRNSKLNLVDLAGSERLSVTGAVGKRLEECKKINQSLSTLGNVISALTDTKSRTHIPYRDSKLTRLLEDSLGGNCKTTMMTMISPSYMCFSETLSSLKFANRAKNIRNDAKINEDCDQKSLIKKYEIELKTLRKVLEEKDKDMYDKELLYKLEEAKMKAEEDKAIMRKIIDENKKEKETLKMKLGLLAYKNPESISQLKTLESDKLKILEYNNKVKSLDNNQQELEFSKSQINRYKEMLSKQRNLMIGLTARLSERNNIIIKLQEEIDDCEKTQKLLKEQLERKSERMKLIEEHCNKKGVELPKENKEEEFKLKIENKRYNSYAVDCGEELSEVPIALMTADEKIIELMEIIENQKITFAQIEKDLYLRSEELKQKEQELMKTRKLLSDTQNELIKTQNENETLIKERQKLMLQIETSLLCIFLVN